MVCLLAVSVALLYLGALNKYWMRSEKYLVIGLHGRVKGERNDFCHLIPCSFTTLSKINMRLILQNLIEEKRRFGFTSGPAISNIYGKIMTAKEIDDKLHETLIEIFDEHPQMFPILVDSHEKIYTNYQCFRTFRRTSNTRATERKIDTNDVNVINRWHVVEAARGKKPNLPMNQHYAQLELLVDPFLRYTGNM